MHTVSFFSFKGGVGRTNLLLNVAYGLAQRGDFVVIADWDLHAPGFSLNPLFFRPLEEPEIETDIRPGVLDFLDSALDPDQQSKIIDPKTLAQPTRLGQEDRAAGKFKETGDIWSIPAGRFDPQSDIHEYDKQLRRVQGRNLADWLIRYAEQNNESGEINNPHALLQFFRERIEAIRHPETNKTPDWLLIDSRTGMTEIGDLLLHTEFVDRMVLVSGFNEQNLAGIESVIRTIQQKTPVANLRSQLTLVFSPVPQGEEELKQRRFSAIGHCIQGLARVRDGEPEPLPKAISIPYHPRIALHEEIMLRNFPQSDLTTGYEQLIEDLRGRAEESLKKQQQQLHQSLQEADVLPNQRKEQQPKLPSAPFAQLPVWNWPDPELSHRDFIPSIDDSDLPLLSGVSRSISLTKEEKEKVLLSLGRINEQQKQDLRQIFSDERDRFSEWVGTHALDVFELAVERFTGWLDYWIENKLVESENTLQALLSGERDEYLGTWARISVFWSLLAENYLEEQSLWKQAEQAYRRALELDSNYAPNWNALGNLLKNHLQRYDEAEQAYREAIQRDEKLAHPWNGLGNLLSDHLQRYDEAEQAYREAIQRDEKLAHPWNGLGNLLKNHLQRYDEAEQAYREAIQRDEKDAYPWNGLGNLLKNNLQRYDEAEQAYREAIQRDEKFAYPWYGLGNLLTDHLQRYDEAEQAYREAIQRDEKDAVPWNGLGNLLKNHLQRYDEAEQAYREAIQRDEKLAYPWNGLGNLLSDHLQRYDEAEQAYREAIQRDEKFAYPWYGLGNLLKNHLQRYDEAEQTYREAIQRDEKWAYPWNNLGNLFVRQERYAEAEQAFRQAIALSEEKASLYLTLAELGLVTNNKVLTEEGLEGAENSVQTKKYQIILALMQLAYAIQQQSVPEVESVHKVLLAHKIKDQIGLDWNFDDQAPFIERLNKDSANLYQAWLDAFSKDEQKRNQADPQAAFIVWQQANSAG